MKRINSTMSITCMALLMTCTSAGAQLSWSWITRPVPSQLIIDSKEGHINDDHNIFEKYDVSKNVKERRQRLDAFASYLKENPHFQGYIMSYAGRRSCVGEAVIRGKSAQTYLVKSKGIKDSRITVIDAGYRERWVIELWYGVVGGSRPTPLQTIGREEVILKSCGR